jgi:fibronectin-binding autotransporter adhesin
MVAISIALRRSSRLFAAFALLGLFGAPFASAQTLTWSATSGTTWDTTTANWSGSTYSDGDSVDFGDPVPDGGGVMVQSAGVSPSEVDVSNNSGTYDITGGPIEGSGSLEKTGDGILILGSSNSYSGGTDITGGTLILTAGDDALGNPSGALTLDGGALSIQTTPLVSSRSFLINAGGGAIDTGGIDSSISGSVTGVGLLTKTGSGDLTISGPIGNSSQSLSISVMAGSLTVSEPGAQYVTMPGTAGDFTGDLNIGSGVSLQIAGGSDPSTPVLINGGGTVHVIGSNASIAANGFVEIDNNIVLNSQSLAPPFSTSLTASLSSQLTIGGTISGASDVSFVSAGTHSTPLFLLNAPATYTGNTYLDFPTGGVLRLGVDDALPVNTQLSFGERAGALDLNGFDQTISALSDQDYDNGITNSGVATSTLTVNQNTDTTFASSIGTPTVIGTNLSNGPDLNNINFVKSGTGTLILTGNESYDGATTVSGGTLVVSGGISGSLGGITNTSNLSVQNGAALAGQGLIDVIGNFDLQAGGTLDVSLPASVPGGYDGQLMVGGTISLAGPISLSLQDGFTASPGDLFFIILNQGGVPVAGTFAGDPSVIILPGPDGPVTFQVGYTGDSAADTFTGGNDVVLEVVIPEPDYTDFAVVALGLLMIWKSSRSRLRLTQSSLQTNAHGRSES